MQTCWRGYLTSASAYTQDGACKLGMQDGEAQPLHAGGFKRVCAHCLLRYTLPMAELGGNFYDSLKSLTAGYASFDYEEGALRKADLVRLDLLLNGEAVDAMARIVHRWAHVSTTCAPLGGAAPNSPGCLSQSWCCACAPLHALHARRAGARRSASAARCARR